MAVPILALETCIDSLVGVSMKSVNLAKQQRLKQALQPYIQQLLNDISYMSWYAEQVTKATFVLQYPWEWYKVQGHFARAHQYVRALRKIGVGHKGIDGYVTLAEKITSANDAQQLYQACRGLQQELKILSREDHVQELVKWIVYPTNLSLSPGAAFAFLLAGKIATEMFVPLLSGHEVMLYGYLDGLQSTGLVEVEEWAGKINKLRRYVEMGECIAALVVAVGVVVMAYMGAVVRIIASICVAVFVYWYWFVKSHQRHTDLHCQQDSINDDKQTSQLTQAQPALDQAWIPDQYLRGLGEYKEQLVAKAVEVKQSLVQATATSKVYKTLTGDLHFQQDSINDDKQTSQLTQAQPALDQAWIPDQYLRGLGEYKEQLVAKAVEVKQSLVEATATSKVYKTLMGDLS